MFTIIFKIYIVVNLVLNRIISIVNPQQEYIFIWLCSHDGLTMWKKCYSSRKPWAHVYRKTDFIILIFSPLWLVFKNDYNDVAWDHKQSSCGLQSNAFNWLNKTKNICLLRNKHFFVLVKWWSKGKLVLVKVSGLRILHCCFYWWFTIHALCWLVPNADIQSRI